VSREPWALCRGLYAVGFMPQPNNSARLGFKPKATDYRLGFKPKVTPEMTTEK
jgi:hypothetical protein